MRTSRISRDTALVVATLLRPRKTRSSGSAAREHGSVGEEEEEEKALPAAKDEKLSTFNEDRGKQLQPEVAKSQGRRLAATRSSQKRKRGVDGDPGVVDGAELKVEMGTTSLPHAGETSTLVTNGQTDNLPARSTKSLAKSGRSKPRTASRTTKTTKLNEDDATAVAPPPHWKEVYELTRQMRARIPAPVDTDGCERSADPAAPPAVQRFQTLVALMLSSQTKDTVTAAAVRGLQRDLPGGLTIPSLLATPPTELDAKIGRVGFHTTKTRHLLATASILRQQHASDIPATLAGLLALPGVGPKMAHLTLSAAWGVTAGIGVDVHVHRITNRWGWHRTKAPEETRRALEAWLPRERWREINALLVGFGQTVCLPVGPRCGRCDIAPTGLCPSAVVGRERGKRQSVVVRSGVGGAATGEEEVEVMKEEEAAQTDVDRGVMDIEDLGGTDRRRSRRLRS